MNILISKICETQIAIGAAMGLYHLHRKNIIHCDIRAANVFVDENYNAKVNIRTITPVVMIH